MVSIVRPRPGVDPNGPVESRGHLVVIWASLFTSLSVFFVSARLVSRIWLYKIRRIYAEDVFIIAGLIMVIPLNIVACLCTLHGFGRHIWHITEQDAIEFQKYFMHVIWGFPAAHLLIKLSFVAFYNRLYYNTYYKWIINLVYGLLVVGYTVFIILGIVPCVPIRKFWDPKTPGSCLNTDKQYRACGSFNLIIDIVILILPIPIVQHAKVNTKQKFLLAILFGLGIFCCIISALRISVLFNFDFDSAIPDETWNLVLVTIWSSIELNVGIIVACLPHLNRMAKRVCAAYKSRARPDNESEKETSSGVDHPEKDDKYSDPRGPITREIESAMKSVASVEFKVAGPRS